MGKASIKNWSEFQHYKDRSPPWIKLHHSLLDDYGFQSLPLASKALAPMLWLLASESKDGTFDVDSKVLAFRLRWDIADVNIGLIPLINNGFVVVDSETLAACLQDATPETEGETEAEAEVVVVSARAREDIITIGNRILEIAGLDPAKWTGTFGVVHAWIAEGVDPELDIYPAVKAVTRQAGYEPPSTLKYFEKPIMRAKRDRVTGVPAPPQRQGNVTPMGGYKHVPDKNEGDRQHRAAFREWFTNGQKGEKPVRQWWDDDGNVVKEAANG